MFHNLTPDSLSQPRLHEIYFSYSLPQYSSTAPSESPSTRPIAFSNPRQTLINTHQHAEPQIIGDVECKPEQRQRIPAPVHEPAVHPLPGHTCIHLLSCLLSRAVCRLAEFSFESNLCQSSCCILQHLVEFTHCLICGVESFECAALPSRPSRSLACARQSVPALVIFGSFKLFLFILFIDLFVVCRVCCHRLSCPSPPRSLPPRPWPSTHRRLSRKHALFTSQPSTAANDTLAQADSIPSRLPRRHARLP